MKNILVVFIIMLVCSPVYADNDKNIIIVKLEFPEFSNFKTGEKLSLDKYFQQKNLIDVELDYSPRLNRNVLLHSKGRIRYHEMALFEITSAFVATKILNDFWISMQKSLKNENGVCNLVISDNGSLVNFENFQLKHRQGDGQPGTRKIISSQTDSSWEIMCPSEKGNYEKISSGNYFMIYIDIYENRNPKQFGHSYHLFSYLISLGK